MGPKKSPVEDEWKRKIENSPLNDSIWKAKVVMIESAGSEQDRIYLTKFEEFATEDKRFVIKNISKTETMFMINQLGSEKKVKDETFRIFEECQMYLKDKQEIPTFMVALAIKHLMLKLKQEYLIIQKQRLLVKEGLQKESMTMIETVEVKNIRDIQSKFSEPEKPNKSKKRKGAESSINIVPDLDKKYNTKLRIRGEEWRDKIYVNDYPSDGPNLYIAVSGFQDPYLAEYLVKLGIPLTAIVQIRIDLPATKVPSSLMRPTKRGQDQADTLMEKYQKFWEHLQLRRALKESSEILKGSAFIIFSPPYYEYAILSGNAEKIYDEICYLLYDVQDLSRQHLSYLKCIKIVQVPTDSIDEYPFSIYKNVIENLPLESLSVYSILDSILQVVSNNYDNKNVTLTRSSTATTLVSSNLKTPNINFNKVEKAQNLTENILDELIYSNKNKTYRPTVGEEYENYKDPIVIDYGDFNKIKTFHLNNNTVNLESFIYTVLHEMPIHRLWNQLFRSEDKEVKINFHINLLISCFERKHINSSELIRLLNILACRKLYNNRSSKLKVHIPESTIVELKKKKLKRSILAEPFTKRVIHSYHESPIKSFEENYTPFISPDDSQNIHFIFECPDITELVSVSEIHSNVSSNDIINEYDYFEDYTGINSLQILNEYFYEFNCVDYKYCEVTDSIILMFYNSHDENGLERNEWRKHLSTPVCLQDFFDFVFEEKYDWIKNQEKMYDEIIELKNKSEFSVIADVVATTSCVDQVIEPNTDLLIEGSLKYKEYISKLEAEAETDNSTETKIYSKKSVRNSTATSANSSKKKTIATSTPKSGVNASSIQSSNSELIPCSKEFSAYNLGDRRIELLGKKSVFYSEDGTSVSTDYYITIPDNMEFVSLKITPGYNSNVIRIHRALEEFSKRQYVDKHESFSITTENNVMINIIKKTIEILKINKQSVLHINKNISSPLPELNESALINDIYHKIIITWPNGLIIESVHDEITYEITHIKQHFIKPPLNNDEELRCINNFGEVIVFKSNGHIEVLRPDGTFIYITKTEKVLTTCENENLEKTSNSSSFSKNQKSKPKSSKSSKSSMKSSKIGDTPVSSKSVLTQEQYELKIQDYYIIDCCGLKQTYVNRNLNCTEKILVRTATDYNLPEIFSRRMDDTNFLINKDGVQVLTFHDKTRIVSTFYIEEPEIYPEWTDEEIEYFGITTNNESIKSSDVGLETSASHSSIKGYVEKHNTVIDNNGFVSVLLNFAIEHPNFASVSVNPFNKLITILSPQNVCVNINETEFDFILDKDTRASFNGYKLNIMYEPCKICAIETLCEVDIIKQKNISLNEMTWLKMVDVFGKKLTVSVAGEMTVTDTNENCDTQNHDMDRKFETTDHICKIKKTSKNQKFIILRRDLTSSGLVHRDTVKELKNCGQMDPWFSINTVDTIGNSRKILSILSPIYLNESEKWLMESKLANKPQYLTYKDLKKDEGKGFYHWMRPYGRFEPNPRKPQNVLAPQLPKAFLLRTFEQQWSEHNREKLKGGRELIEAILRYRKLLESDYLDTINPNIIDSRTDQERDADQNIQNIAHKVYMDLKNRIENNMYENKKPGITTKDGEITGQTLNEEFTDKEELKLNYKDTKDVLRELDKVEPLTPNLVRYWKNRAAEAEKEKYYRDLLRQDKVTSYFNNLMGGAIWWEVANIASTAPDVAESAKQLSSTQLHDQPEED